MNPSNANFWDDLLLTIEEGQVVPIVGRALLTVETPNGPRQFHEIVAEKLADELNISRAALPPVFDTNDVVCAHEGFHGDPMAINPRVVRIVRNLKVPLPRPLRQLAEIPNFRLFVSTCFDTLLEETLASVRGMSPAVISFPPASANTDYDERFLTSHGSAVFQILGRVSASASFAVTEGQVLEQMHELMSGPRRPEKLIGKLRESHLLVLGVSFPDWLTRFLLRLARTKPLWDSRPMMEVIADNGRSVQDFALFLRHFSPQQSHLFTRGSPLDFVDELHRRWLERHPARVEQQVGLPGAVEKPVEMARGSIFVSYASEDRERAFRLADQLSAAGLEIWVDRRLNPGDDYRSIIERHIRECAAFIPVLSRHTQTEDERWFRREWAIACERAKYYFGTERPFLFPVVVDDTPVGELKETRRELFGRSAARAPNGCSPAPLVDELDRAQKAWRRQFGRA